MKRLLSLPCAAAVTLLIVLLMSAGAQQVTITVHASDEGGTVSGGGTYDVSTPVTVHGSCLHGTHFSAWWDPNVGHVSSDADYTFLATVDRDLYASFCYHVTATANPISGDFSVGAAGFLIEQGRATVPVKGIAIAGNILEIFRNVEMVGNDLRFFGAVGSPSLRIAALDVSGE